MACASSPTQVMPVPSGPQQADDVGLQRVGVLVLVHQHVVEALAHAGAAGRVGEQAAPEEQQVVVVQHLLLLLGVRVGGEELRQALLRRQAPGEGGVQHLVQRQLRVDAAGVDVEAGGLLREPRAAAAEAEARAGDVHEVLRVAAVHDREVRLHADVARVDAEQAGGDGVEGAAPDALGGAAGLVAARREHRLDPAQHLGGGAAREREQQDAPRVRAALDEVGDAVHERRRLAGAGAGDDEQRPVAVLGGGELLGVELHEHEGVLLGGCRRLAPAPDGCERTFEAGRPPGGSGPGARRRTPAPGVGSADEPDRGRRARTTQHR